MPVHPPQGGQFDVLDGLPQPLASGSIDQLGIVVAVDGLGQVVVVAVPDGSYGGHRTDLGEAFTVANRCELRSGIEVTGQARQRVPRDQRGHLNRVEHHRRAHVRRDPPTDEHPTERVDEKAHVGHPGPGRDVGQVGTDPQLVGGCRAEVTLDQIGMPPRTRARRGGADPSAATHPFDARRPHQPGHLIAAHVVTGPACRFPQLVRPVDAVVVLPQPDQGRTQHGITLGPLRCRPGLGRIVGTRGHRHPC